MGGSSPTIRFVLGCIVGWPNIHDCQAADADLILGAGFTVIRPTELTDKKGEEPAGKYKNATAVTGIGIGAVHKSDVGLFICDEILAKNAEWGGNAVQIYKAKK